MRVGKLHSYKTCDDSSRPTGLDISAEFKDQDGVYCILTFHYDYYTNNIQGLVERILDALFNEKEMPENVSELNIKKTNVRSIARR